jgi:septum formation protein
MIFSWSWRTSSSNGRFEGFDPRKGLRTVGFNHAVTYGARLPDIPQVTTAAQQLAIARREAGIGPDELVEIYRFEAMRYHEPMKPTQLILASSSPRRHDILRACAIPFQIIPAAIDEQPLSHERAEKYVQRLALAKAEAVAQDYPDAVVLGADTIVTIDDLLLGKPQTPEVARQMLHRLRGREHEVLTGVAVVAGRLAEHAGRRFSQAVVSSRIRMRQFTAATIEWYLATGEPLDKAGAYAVQGLGAALVERVEGSYTNAVGLPLTDTLTLLRQFDMAG